MEIILLIPLWMVLACIPAAIAKSKGLSWFKWHMYGFWLFPIALIHGIVAQRPSEKIDMNRTHFECPYCREPIRRGASKCKHCGEALEYMTSEEEAAMEAKE